MTRSESKRAMLYELGAVPVFADALDPDQVAEAVGTARQDVIVHQLTARAGADMRHLERDFALTNQEDPLDPNPAREMRANLAAIRHLGASNDKAKRELRWRPAHASRRQGFAA